MYSTLGFSRETNNVNGAPKEVSWRNTCQTNIVYRPPKNAESARHGSIRPELPLPKRSPEVALLLDTRRNFQYSEHHVLSEKWIDKFISHLPYTEQMRKLKERAFWDRKVPSKSKNGLHQPQRSQHRGKIVTSGPPRPQQKL